MARRPRPTAIKIAEGERKDRINFNEPKAIEHQTGPPDYLDEKGVKAWQGLRAILQEMRVLSEQDRYLLELYGQLYSDYRRTLDMAIEFRPARIQRLASGKIEISKCPVTSDLHRYRDQMIKILIECGLTPSARQSIQVDEILEDDQMRSDELDLELEAWKPQRENLNG
jgi:P27 family predicted phage terminase small subunit